MSDSSSSSASTETPLGSFPSVIVVDSHVSNLRIRPGELWQYRDLAFILAARDLKVRYRQAVIGIGWAVIRPAIAVAMFVAFFALLDRNPVVGDKPYIAVAIIGLMTWQMVAASIADLSESLVRNRHVLTKVYFPRVLIPIATMAVSIADYLVAMTVSIPVLLIFGVRPAWPVLLVPLWVMGVFSLAFSLGLLLSALNARYRDVGHVVPFLLQLGLLASPVVYETQALIPPSWQTIYRVNPLSTLLDGLRWSVLGSQPPTIAETVMTMIGLAVMLSLSWRTFHRWEENLAETI